MSKIYKTDSNGNEVAVESNGKLEYIEAISDDKTLTIADSGKIFMLDGIGEAITLPAVADAKGFNCKFIVDTAVATSSWTITAATSVIYGSAQLAGAVIACSAKNTITLVLAKTLPGDWVSLKCDGVKWFVEGSIVTAAGITFTVVA